MHKETLLVDNFFALKVLFARLSTDITYAMKEPLSIFLFVGVFSIASPIPYKDIHIPDLAVGTQAKRDLSLSYAATQIGSKEGTHIKTITVIKNIDGKKTQPLKIDPKLHKNEEWGSYFRDNFNTYGVIPEVPDIDELFEFVNKKDDKKVKEKETKKNEDEKKTDKSEESTKKEEEVTTTTAATPVEEKAAEEPKDDKVEKIKGDAEIIQPGGKQGKVKSQSLDLGKYSVHESTLLDSNPKNTMRQYFNSKNEKYISSASVPYYYPQYSTSIPNAFPTGNDYSPQASPQPGRGSISVTTPSGKTYDVPVSNVTDNPPYIAPNFRRNQNPVPVQQFVTSSQRPYIAPNLRKSYEVQLNSTNEVNSRHFVPSRQQPAVNVYRNIPTSFRTDSVGGYKPYLPRSRGLRY